MPAASNTWSSSRFSSSASAYWKPEQPPPRTPHAQADVTSGVLAGDELFDLLGGDIGENDHCSSHCICDGVGTLDTYAQREELQQRIEQALPGARVAVEDLTGGALLPGGSASSTSPACRASSSTSCLRRLRRRGGGAIHVLSIKTSTPERTMTNDEIRDFIENAIATNQVMLFMKGTPEEPACGFSVRTAGALNKLDVQYAALDILPEPRIREELSAGRLADDPQLFVQGEWWWLGHRHGDVRVGGSRRHSASSSPRRPRPKEPQPQPQQRPIGLENRLGCA